jgi:hypothetical protein
MNDQSQVSSFFQDPSASSAIVLAAQNVAAPMVQGSPLTFDEQMTGGGVRIVQFAIDASPSMSEVAQLLLEGFNQYYVPAVKEAREDDISALRIGGVAFSSDINQIWQGSDGSFFHPIDELPQLTQREYDPDRGYATALHQAILDATAIAVRYAADVQADTGIDPDIDIVILSDGANNQPPRSASSVKQIITGRDKSRVRYVYFYFETQWGEDDPQGYAINELGIDGEQVQVFGLKPGETREEQAKRFRRLMNVLSKVSASKGTSAVVATAAVQDEELV